MRMDLKGLYPLALSGQKIMIEDCNIVITPPKIKDILLFGEDVFFSAVQVLGKTQDITEKVKEGNPQLEIVSDFQVLLMIMAQDTEITEHVNTFFELVFPDYLVKIEEGSIQFFNPETEALSSMIHPFNFDIFKKYIEVLFTPNRGVKSDLDYNPANDRAAEIAKKLKEGRRRAQEMKKEGKIDSAFGTYISSLSIGLGMDINIFFNYTPFQLFDSFERFTTKMSYDYYKRVASMPFMDVSKTDPPKE